MLFHIAQITFQSADSLPDQTPVHLQLFLAWPPCPDAASQTGEGSAKSGQTGSTVSQLGKFHLDFSLTGYCAGREDIEDKQSPVDNLAGQLRFQISQLGTGQFIVADDAGGICLPDQVF